MSFTTKNRLATSDVLTYLILRLISVFGFQGTTFKNISNMNKVDVYKRQIKQSKVFIGHCTLKTEY